MTAITNQVPSRKPALDGRAAPWRGRSWTALGRLSVRWTDMGMDGRVVSVEPVHCEPIAAVADRARSDDHDRLIWFAAQRRTTTQ
jgi:hypothetical protein